MGCDKNMPGSVMAMARIDRPSIMVYGGAIQPGRLGDRKLFHQQGTGGIEHLSLPEGKALVAFQDGKIAKNPGTTYDFTPFVNATVSR